jgi:acyl carrier protein
MTNDELQTAVLNALREVAPEAAADSIDPEVNFRDQFDFDSIDYLNFARGLEKALDCSIPATDYPKLSSLKGCLAYLSASVAVTA